MPGGRVAGIDASPEIVDRARTKARRASADAAFERAAVEALPYADGEFDAVFGTLMFHHLPRATRGKGAREMRRVLAPGGRLVVVDFGAAGRRRKGLLERIQRGGRVDRGDTVRLLGEAGVRVTESGPMG